MNDIPNPTSKGVAAVDVGAAFADYEAFRQRLIAQRDEARAQAAELRSEVERLRNLVQVTSEQCNRHRSAMAERTASSIADLQSSTIGGNPFGDAYTAGFDTARRLALRIARDES